MKILRRSPRELYDRSLQEIRNLALLARPPKLSLETLPPSPLSGLVLPPVEGIQRLAAEIRAHRFPLLGFEIETGPEIAWRRDYVSGRETGLEYMRRIPYLDAAIAGDHKVIWELNRHQHLVVLALAKDLPEIIAQVESWVAQNPFQRGINWASALEVGFRALSWIWVYHLVGNDLPEGFRRLFLEQLYLHGRHLEVNLSYYFSPNTHLLGEAVALHALGKLFPEFPGATQWREEGARVVAQQMHLQVRDDGSHFEQSTYYHVYAFDMFCFHAGLEPVRQGYREKLQRMERFLHAVMGPSRRLPFIGDDDGGRFFHPYGNREQFGRVQNEASHSSVLFPDSGLAVMTDSRVHAVIDAGPFGPWGSGHSHSDTLSLVLRIGEEDILIDPGTYTYVADPAARDWFRGSAAHNTIRIDGLDQATPVNPFRWTDQPSVRVLDWRASPSEDLLEAQVEYRGFRHVRWVRFVKPDRLEIEDEVTGPPGEHRLEQWWHLGLFGARERVRFDERGRVSDQESWASDAFGERHRMPAVCLAWTGTLPIRFVTQIQL